MAIYDDSDFFDKYYELRQDKNNYNDNIEQPILKELIGSCAGASVLDIGCGYGGTCVWLREQGAARVTGIDNSSRMIDYAKAHNAAAGIRYLVKDAADIPALRERYDLVVSSLVFHYIEDLDRLFGDIRACLNENGRLIFSMEHPVYTACLSTADNWQFDDEGKKCAFKLDHYGLEGERQVEWLGKMITKYHRKTATILNSLIRAGFTPLVLVEPSPTEAQIGHYERMRQELHRPAYLIVSAKV